MSDRFTDIKLVRSAVESAIPGRMQVPVCLRAGAGGEQINFVG